MKILIIPDCHGQSDWKDAVKNFKYDKVVFLGDYFDNFEDKFKGEFAAKNFEDICSFIREDTDNRILLAGNHDIENYYFRGGCSGFQPVMYDRYHELLVKNKDILKAVCELDEFVFSHAGVSYVWLDNIKKIEEERTKRFFDLDKADYDKLSDIDKINLAFKSMLDGKMHKDWFCFYRWDMSCCGENTYQSPLWIRPRSLLEASAFDKQVVGHTEYCLYDTVFLKSKRMKCLVITDSPCHNTFKVLDTENYQEPILIDDFFKVLKSDKKTLYDLKSLKAEKKETLKNLKNAFGEYSEFLYKNYFEE